MQHQCTNTHNCAPRNEGYRELHAAQHSRTRRLPYRTRRRGASAVACVAGCLTDRVNLCPWQSPSSQCSSDEDPITAAPGA